MELRFSVFGFTGFKMTVLFLMFPIEVWKVDYCPYCQAAQPATAGQRGWGRRGNPCHLSTGSRGFRFGCLTRKDGCPSSEDFFSFSHKSE